TAREAAEALRPLAGQGAYLLFTLGLIGTGMLAVPVLAGSAAYVVAEAQAWSGALDDHPRLAPGFYGVIAVAMLIGLALDYVGFQGGKILLWGGVLKGVLAPPLIVLVVLLTSHPAIMGTHASSPLLRACGWATAVVMTAAGIGMLVTL